MATKADKKGSAVQNNMSDKPDDYQKALDLAEAGSYAEALACIQGYLVSSPDDAEALNDTGAILHCMGQSDEAIEQLIKAKTAQPDSAETIWNLSEMYLAMGNAAEAMKLFGDMERIGILSADVLNRTATVFIDENNLSDALKMLNWSLDLSPEQEILHPMIEIIKHKKAETDPN